jgi:2-polyprenyl-3-methyl-5-hydroxy-6-metoxy-1,4-benzoquinol methylase
MELREDILQNLLNQVVADSGAAWQVPLVVLGDELGLYRGLAKRGLTSSAELAEETGTTERYVREWLRAQTAAGYVSYDKATDRYFLSNEQTALFADETSPVFMVGSYQAILAAGKSEPQVRDAFRTGKGVAWGAHDHSLFCGTERFYGSSYRAHLVQQWIPALDGIEARLRAGGRVADVGCGHGASTVLMAEAFPRSTFIGIDAHASSIETAKQRAAAAGVADRVDFEVSTAQSYAHGPYDLIAFFDALHDMGDPVGALANAREQLADGGAVMLVEPRASDHVADNLNPVGRIFYAASTMLCTPGALAQDGGYALGAQAGEAQLRSVATEAGFTTFRRAAETPFNLILEARR